MGFDNMIMKKKYKVRVLIAGLMLLMLDSANSFAQINKFSGNWMIDNSKSDVSGLSFDLAAPKKLVVSLIDDSIAVIRTFAGKEPSKQILKFNDTSLEDLPERNILRLSSVKADKTSISFKWHYEINGNEWRYDRTEQWSLSNDGKLLTIDRMTTLPDKVDKVKAVYNKQP
jgi:hypothetical protein